jgi:hypothetical protein
MDGDVIFNMIVRSEVGKRCAEQWLDNLNYLPRMIVCMGKRATQPRRDMPRNKEFVCQNIPPPA